MAAVTRGQSRGGCRSPGTVITNGRKPRGSNDRKAKIRAPRGRVQGAPRPPVAPSHRLVRPSCLTGPLLGPPPPSSPPGGPVPPTTRPGAGLDVNLCEGHNSVLSSGLEHTPLWSWESRGQQGSPSEGPRGRAPWPLLPLPSGLVAVAPRARLCLHLPPSLRLVSLCLSSYERGHWSQWVRGSCWPPATWSPTRVPF